MVDMSGALFPKPGRFKKAREGGKLSAAMLNAINDAIYRVISGTGMLHANRYGDRLVLSHQDREAIIARPPVFQLFRVISESPDHVVCAPFWFTDDPESKYGYGEFSQPPNSDPIQNVAVAKPFLLQQTPWDDQTVPYLWGTVKYTYVATGKRIAKGNENGTGPDIFETQYITPSYFSGDIILATNVATQFKNPKWQAGDKSNYVTTWQDINQGARVWASLC
jgi:hypothetical protein